jgi:hypothetical protein
MNAFGKDTNDRLLSVIFGLVLPLASSFFVIKIFESLIIKIFVPGRALDTGVIAMSPELSVAIIGGLIGGVLGAAGTLITSYYGPRKFEEWRENRLEERLNGPRKRLLKEMLEDTRFADGRSLETLSRVTGTSLDECRRLLIEIAARGITLAGNKEGWALIRRKPLNEP